MSQIPYRANTQSMTFPLLSEQSGRTVINPQTDNTYQRFMSSEGQSPVDTGVPTIYYCHNVMPSTNGWQSIRYNKVFTKPDSSRILDFEQADLIYGAQVVTSGTPPVASIVGTGYKSYISIAGDGTTGLFILEPSTLKWKLINNLPNIPANSYITVATVNGASYIYISNVGCYIYNNVTNSLVERELLGLEKTEILGIVAANGYLNAWTKDSIAWSSTVNVEDFEPSDTSGAGGGQVQEARGNIVICVATSLGYIMYTKENAVSAIYSGNSAFPWNFKSIPSSGGVSNASVVSSQQAQGYQQVYSTNGIQQISHARCNTVVPNVTDFIAGNKFEDFDITTNLFTQEKFNWTMRKKLAVVADRYIVISYGKLPTGAMTHALVLDITQNRMGKLKIVHNSCFELRSLDSTADEIPRDSLAFLQPDGTVQVVDFSIGESSVDSVLMLGKFQYVRQRMMELNMLEVENVETGDDFMAWAIPSLNGKTQNVYTPGYLLEVADNYRKFSWDGAIGVNVSWMLTGTFNINSLVGWFSLVGNP